MEIKIDFKRETLLLGLILLIAAFLRLYNIKDYIIFLGDQGRDVLIIAQIIREHKLTLLGPTASVGGFYLGPFYYYLMVLPLWLANFDPVGPAVMVALFGIATVFLLYLFVKKNFNNQAALFAASLYAVSPLAVKNSRFSWNPNTLPFFSLLYFYLLYLSKKKKSQLYVFFAGIILGACFQLHYLALILAPLGGLLLFNRKVKKWLAEALILFLGTAVSFSPFLFFEIRHGFPNFKTILEFVTRENGALGFYFSDLLPRFSELSQRIFTSMFGFEKNIFTAFIIFLSLGFLIIKFWQPYKKTINILILIWWIGGVSLLGFYQGTIYDYYYSYLYPIPAIVFGLLLGFLATRKLLLFKLASFIIFFIIIFSCLKRQPIFQIPNKVLEQTERIAWLVIEKSEEKPYNFALISASNSDHAYRYFLEIADHKPISLEERVEEQLFVVCESKVCQPLGHPLWEIAAFGRAEIVSEWQDKVGIRIFRLIHHPDSFDWVGKPAPKG